jgi:hypothetical protein
MMFDHNGTYMRGVALEQKGARVVVQTVEDFEEDIQGETLLSHPSLVRGSERLHATALCTVLLICHNAE